MPNPFFNSTVAAAFATMASDTVTITRSVPPATGRTFTTETIYTGAGDLQEGGGSTYFNPGGAVEVADAVLIISASTAGALPAVQVGDIATRASDGKEFEVVSTSSRTWQLYHLELKLKRGPQRFDQKT